MTRRPTGLVVLRVWIEDGSTEPLRVHVRQTHDVSHAPPAGRTVTDADEVVDIVRRFLESSRAAGSPTGDGHGAVEP